MEFADSTRVGGGRDVCTNRCVIVVVGYLWAICRQFVGREGGERERRREMERERERERERQREGDGEEEEGARVLWALGGNLCLSFYGWGSYISPLIFVTSGKR